jgi:hypothetical protein
MVSRRPLTKSTRKETASKKQEAERRGGGGESECV